MSPVMCRLLFIPAIARGQEFLDGCGQLQLWRGINMLAIFEQIVVLIVFVIAGLILGRTGIADVSNAKLLSVIEVYVFLPCVTMRSFSANFTRGYISQNYYLLLASITIIVAIIAFGAPIGNLLGKNDTEKSIYKYCLIFPNYGYFGYAVCSAVFGDQALMSMIFFCIPITFFAYTYGFCILTGVKKIDLKSILNPSMIGIIVGAIIGLSGLQVPLLIRTIMDNAASCMAPVAMILLGLTVSEFWGGGVLTDKRNYLLVALRLVIIPGVLFIILRSFASQELLTSAILCYTMPCGLNAVVFPRLKGMNCTKAAGLIIICTFLSIVTIPLFLHLLL